jgi:hypothetical protein
MTDRILPLFLCALISDGLAWSAGRDVSAGASVANGRYQVTFTGLQPCCPAVLRFAVHEQDGTAARSLELQGCLLSVAELSLTPQGKLLATGSLSAGGEAVLIGDLASRRQQEALWTYGHRLSPSGRYLAFQTHYPRLAVPPEARQSIIAVYNLLSAPSPAEDRSRDFLPRQDLGIPIFPEANARSRSHDPRQGEQLSYVSPLLWSQDERQLVFVVRSGSQSYELVRVEAEEGFQSVRSARRPIDVRRYVTPRWAQARTEEEQRRPPELIIEALDWKDADTVLLQTLPELGLDPSIELDLPQMTDNERG